MAVVIRLQGLPLVAGPADIRRFFSGLNIPDGGVHIIGGEKGEAFIIFATDEDARQAMSYSGGFIKDSRIQFFLSSKTEMQNIIEINRKRFDRGGRETGSRRTGSNNSGPSGVGSLSNLVAAIKKGIGKSSYDSRVPLEDEFHSSGSRNSNINISKSNFNQPRKESFKSDRLYLFIRGMPYSSTEDDVLNFFSGLQVERILMLKTNGQNNGDGVVKFATLSDAMKGLQRDRNYMGARFIEVRPSNEGAWIKYGGRIDEKIDHSFHFEHNLNKGNYSSSREYSKREPSYLPSRKRSRSRTPPRRVMSHAHSRSPSWRIMERSYSRSPSRRIMARAYSRSPRRVMAHTGSRSPPRRVMARNGSRSPRRVTACMHSNSPKRITASTHSRSPRRVKTHSRSPFSGSTQSHSPQSKEYCIHVKNLSAAVEKRDLQVFFEEPTLMNKDITFLKSHDNEARSKDAVITFRSERAYTSALSYHKLDLFGRQVYIFPVSKRTVLELIGSSEVKRSPERHHHVKDKNNQDGYSGSKTCVYVRNFPFDVTNVEVQKFFAGFNIDDNDIYLLFDDKGVGLGEALVKFRTEDQARKAESLNRRRFLGTEVLLRCIPEEQMQEFGINVSSASNEKMQGHHHTCEREENFYSVDSQGPSVQGDVKHPSDYRCLSDDFICSPDNFRGPPPFTEFGEGISGNFPDRRFMPDSNFGGGSDCVTLIKLKNIPFRASPNEILDFFHGYKIIPESLSVQHNEYGMSSGEAIIALVNYKEAEAAINELNDRPIGQRKVRLSLA
ncbi:RNA-binding protein 12B [Python bivittatus]|uniref:RNA-binding protein 12B n=1 Tax=Python bivittatus TaxID=176946 RepID=A0A9F5J626_PYTBI|nr:RNA-binding protein 12B [Python bivittatus]XP_025028008.1 RNA-binding protein 12B [Python bivittatus]XP_025028009.1 RNA-binding protein 12B [Python bivittatus]XP_025028011.1 RNA-binding protein 12B [Python bivittatus]